MDGDLRGADSAPLESGLVLFTLLARFFGVPADLSDLKHRLGNGQTPAEVPNLLRAARWLNLKARLVEPVYCGLSRRETMAGTSPELLPKVNNPMCHRNIMENQLRPLRVKNDY
ncbi:hypothetical protein [Magnetospirillum fulvum]|uniref:Uncharacterized protein n=1 Tax=Magnetospirillum fulvum TaxID=1082 RepID=A0A1H6I995_MAGFU|nr:hypothetical protein [Magnetospirillum fulvum]SEH43517.1 hypothetical protein SAMN04244559_02292 [Magnetospirillum fulvum]